MINGVYANPNIGGAGSVQAAQSVQRVAPVQRDTQRIESIYAEQRSYIMGLQNMTRQIGGQLHGLAMSQTDNSNAGDLNGMNSLYSLAGMSRMSGAAGLQNYFSMFVRGQDGSFSVDLSGVSPEMRGELIAKAQEDVSEDGFFGVAKTSERIFGMAEALTGGDPAKMEKMRQVVDKAFESVSKLFGGMDKMPEISRQTYDAVMQRFADFRAGTQDNNKTVDLQETS